jgi:hypothetical protein
VSFVQWLEYFPLVRFGNTVIMLQGTVGEALEKEVESPVLGCENVQKQVIRVLQNPSKRPAL